MGRLPHLAAAAAAAAARPACVVVVADRDGADVIAHANGTEAAVEHFLLGKREPSHKGHGQEKPPAVHHIKAVAEQLAEQQVAVLLLAADISQDADASPGYRLGSSPTQLLPADEGDGIDVPLEDGLVWAALHQDAIVVVPPGRTGPLAGEPAVALLRRGQPRDRS